MESNIIVKPTGKTFGVFGVTAEGVEELIEGGFFSRQAAETARDNWERECTQDAVERAERSAGWDPNP